MSVPRQILFIQGGGEGAHDSWDEKLVASLRDALGEGYEVRHPRMPEEHDPSYVRWSAAIRRELTTLDEGAVVAGHSVGGTILINTLAERSSEQQLRVIVLISAPSVRADGWPGEDFELPLDLDERLPPGVPVHVFHGLRDPIVPPSHADLYARAIPAGASSTVA